MKERRLVGLLFFVLVCCAVIVIASGGWTLLQWPVGAVYLALWLGWWLLIAVGRKRGVVSAYNRSQRLIYILGIVALVGLVVVLPWEYAHCPGPIPCDGPLAWIGLALSSLVGLGLTLLVVPLIVRRIEREEEMLAREFSQEYERYRQQAQWRLIPYGF